MHTKMKPGKLNGASSDRNKAGEQREKLILITSVHKVSLLSIFTYLSEDYRLRGR